jgi:hypothetical protein
MVLRLGEDMLIAFRVQGAGQAVGDLSQDSPDFTRRIQCSSKVRE